MKGYKGDIPESGFPVDHNVALLGHELGNVLNGLLGMAELLGDSGLNAEQLRWLKAIEHSGRQMQSLIQTVRFFESESGLGIVPRYNRTDGIELLEQVVISHTPAARLRNNQLFLVLDPGLPKHWFCDSCLVRQLLDNLVGNAIKFTSAGKIVIEVAAVPGSGTASEMLEFRISDTGRGLGVAAGKHLFEAYQRSCPSRGDQSGDRGLGLFICRNIVLAMNGRISCASPKSGGASFTVTLPEALIFSETHSPVLNSSLLSQVRCQLKLEEPLRCSVANFLTRLGVSSTNREPPAPRASGHSIILLISDAAGMTENPLPGLLLTPRSQPGLELRSRTLDAPVLESSLGILLFEMALQCRGLAIRNGIPGSTPEQR